MVTNEINTDICLGTMIGGYNVQSLVKLLKFKDSNIA
ncbi:MAG: hypothetical protein ACKO2V_09765, partial [Snowella sp.]